MKSAAGRSFCPRLSEACHLLPLIRSSLVAAAPPAPATVVELVPIVEDGLFGCELIPDDAAHVFPIIGRNAQGEPVLRKNSYGPGAAGALRLVAVNGRFLSRRGRAAQYIVQRRDCRFADWLAAAEAAWVQLLPPYPPGSQRRTPVLREAAHGWLDKALVAARSRLGRWDPFIEIFGLPEEAQLGFALSGAGGEHGELRFQQPDTWVLRWSAPPEVVCESWSPRSEGLKAGNDRVNDCLRFPDRRARCRRATDRGEFPDSWAGIERRRWRERRAADQRAS